MTDITEFMRSEQHLESNYDSFVDTGFNEHDYLEKTTELTQIVKNENHLKDDGIHYGKITCQKSGLDDFVDPNKAEETYSRRERRKFRDRSSERGELRERSNEKRKSRGRSDKRGRLRDKSGERGNSRGRSIDRGKWRCRSRERRKSRGASRERRKSRDRIVDKGKSRDRSRDRRRSRDRSGEGRKWRGKSRERGQLRDNSPYRGKRRGRIGKKREGKWRGKGQGMGKSRNRSEDRGRWREKSRDTSRENLRDGSLESAEIRVNRRERRDRDCRSRSRSCHEREKKRELLIEMEQELELENTGRFKENKETLEPDPGNTGRDQRTVFVYEMSKKATERDVHEFFSKAGKVKDVRLIMEKNSGFSKGVGYIEFYDVISVPMAIALSGQLLFGEPVMVKPYEAEENLVQTNASGGLSDVGPSGAAENRILVGNLHFSMTEIKLKKIFEAFGPVESIQLPLDPETGHCKGCGVVQFSRLEHAREAHSLNGKLEIAGRTIKVSSVTDHILVQDSGPKAVEFDDHHHHHHEGGGLVSLVTDDILVQDSGAKAEDFDDERGGLVSSAADHILVKCSGAKTADDDDQGAGTASSVVESIGTPMLNGAATSQLVTSTPIVGTTDIPAPVLTPQVPKVMTQKPIGKASECILVMNMFDPDTEDDPKFDLDIKDDVHYECSKYGRVEHIHVDKNSAGYVYVRLNSVEGALISRQAMHNRLFGGRLISAIFLQPDEYHAKFTDEA